MPSVYIISTSRDALRSSSRRRAYQDLTDATPSYSTYVGTLECFGWTPPPDRICQRYSGVSRVVQDYVMEDERAKAGV